MIKKHRKFCRLGLTHLDATPIFKNFSKSKNYILHLYLWPPIPLIMWHSKAMDKGKIEAMATKFSEKFAISMLKKHRKFCRRGLTHLDATPIFKKSFRYL